jgi:hypothetical protein
MNLAEVITLLRGPAPIVDADRAAAAAELERVQLVLEQLSSKVFYSPRDRTGEAGTRTVQGLAASALYGGRP